MVNIMTDEQFKYWLLGFIEDKKTLTAEQIYLIKAKSVTPSISFGTYTTTPIIAPYNTPITCGNGTHNTNHPGSVLL